MPQGPDPLDHLHALERAVNGFAKVVFGLWALYIVFAVILLFMALTANHRQLLFDEPLELSIFSLAIKLPIYWFFFLGPFVFVSFHIFLMAQVRLLGHKAVAYNEAINENVPSDRERKLIRLRLTDPLLAQILAGAMRERWLDLLLRAIAWITLALGPIGIILTLQIKFLPYHDAGVTLTHRVLLFAELLIAFVVFPLVFDTGRVFSSKKVIWRAARVGGRVGLVGLCVASVAGCLLFAFPGERHLDVLKNLQNLLGKGNSSFCETILKVNDHLEVYFPDADHKMFLADNKRTPNFQGRDLSCGNFEESDFSGFQFRHAFMRGARLFKATLTDAKLEGADLSEANLGRAILTTANLERAILSKADLNGAQLISAVLKGAKLVGATFSGADLTDAKLEDADLKEAKLVGAILRVAKLNKVTLANMDLHGVQFIMADLSGAKLSGANLHDADFRGANLQDADLRNAELQKAWLYEAKLRGAQLQGAKLQDADFSSADFSGADVSGVNFQGADLSLAKLRDARNLCKADLSGAKVADLPRSPRCLRPHGPQRQPER